MIIIEDSREQRPLKFIAPYVEYVMKSKLDYGDYACVIKDNIVPIIFERKSLADLFGTLGNGHGRFKKELKRAEEDKVTIIILIESSYRQVLTGYARSKMSGKSVLRTLFTYMLKHGVPFVCTGTRWDSEVFIQEFYYSWEKNCG